MKKYLTDIDPIANIIWSHFTSETSSKAPSLAVISNCTHKSLGKLLASSGNFSKVDSFPLFAIKRDYIDQAFENLNSYDFIVSAVHYSDWGPFEFLRFKSHFKNKVVFFTTPFFSGQHPDLVSLRDKNGNEVSSPIGPYHSGLVYWSYLNEVPINVVVKTLSSPAGSLDDMGNASTWFSAERAWISSLNNLKARDEESKLQTWDIYEKICSNFIGMYTYNHPSLLILAGLANRILNRLNFNCVISDNPFWLPHDLSNDCVFPISNFSYVKPKQLPMNGINYQSYQGAFNTRFKNSFLSLPAFVTKCYQKYKIESERVGTLYAKTPNYIASELNDKIECMFGN